MKTLKKLVVIGFVALFLFNGSIPNAKAANKKSVDKDCKNSNYALIVSLGPIVNQAIDEIYKDIPGGKRHWAPWDTKILNIEQLYGEGGSYNVTLKVHTFVGAHNPPGGYDTLKIEVTAFGSKLLEAQHKEE